MEFFPFALSLKPRWLVAQIQPGVDSEASMLTLLPRQLQP